MSTPFAAAIANFCEQKSPCRCRVYYGNLAQLANLTSALAALTPEVPVEIHYLDSGASMTDRVVRYVVHAELTPAS